MDRHHGQSRRRMLPNCSVGLCTRRTLPHAISMEIRSGCQTLSEIASSVCESPPCHGESIAPHAGKLYSVLACQAANNSSEIASALSLLSVVCLSSMQTLIPNNSTTARDEDINKNSDLQVPFFFFWRGHYAPLKSRMAKLQVDKRKLSTTPTIVVCV